MPRHSGFTTAVKSFRTTEFYLTLVFIAAVLLATYMGGDSLARADGWRYAVSQRLPSLPVRLLRLALSGGVSLAAFSLGLFGGCLTLVVVRSGNVRWWTRLRDALIFLGGSPV